MSNIATAQVEAEKFLRSRGFNATHKCVRVLKEAKTWEDIWDALYLAAEVVGERKGWGDEGIGELHGQFLDEILKTSKIDIAKEMCNEFDRNNSK